MQFLYLRILNKCKWILDVIQETIKLNNNQLFFKLNKIFETKKFDNNNVILFDHFNSLNHQLIRLIY